MSPDKAALAEKSGVLRQELKAWEKRFADTNGGKKAGRDDIKADTVIAAKYKEYTRLRDVLSGKTATYRSPEKKRKIAHDIASQPSFTPAKIRSERHDENVPLDPSAIGAEMLTPAHVRTMIGPTPQKDGLVLGLFDLLPGDTPSRGDRSALKDIPTNVACTPSKANRQAEERDCADSATARTSRTPQSSGKRHFLDTFVTPNKRKRGEDRTPSSSRPHLFATPSFMRTTQTLETVVEAHESPEVARPWRRRGLGRSLSSIIRGRKDQEAEEKRQVEERLDEDLDLLRELEQEADGFDVPTSKPQSIPRVIEDSQAGPMKLGPDELESESDLDEADQASALGRDGKPRKVWKKKGQKRTTRRVIMRPVTQKAAPTQTDPAIDHNDDGLTIPETQAADDYLNGVASSDDEYHGDSTGEEASSRQIRPKAAYPKRAADADGQNDTKVKKVDANATAHANFRRLKIKSKNAKGKGRFGRRR